MFHLPGIPGLQASQCIRQGGKQRPLHHRHGRKGRRKKKERAGMGKAGRHMATCQMLWEIKRRARACKEWWKYVWERGREGEVVCQKVAVCQVFSDIITPNGSSMFFLSV